MKGNETEREREEGVCGGTEVKRHMPGGRDRDRATERKEFLKLKDRVPAGEDVEQIVHEFKCARALTRKTMM